MKWRMRKECQRTLLQRMRKLRTSTTIPATLGWYRANLTRLLDGNIRTTMAVTVQMNITLGEANLVWSQFHAQMTLSVGYGWSE